MRATEWSMTLRSEADQADFDRMRAILVNTLGLNWHGGLGEPDGSEVADECAEELWAAGFRHMGMRADIIQAVDRILAALPMDETGHIADCGFDANDEKCDCYSLRGRLADILRDGLAWLTEDDELLTEDDR